ncbi:MAG: hypothetical protein P8M72_00025 [Gammaproteobacteria bacterium]|nr:hypothetical protein [Gammaproteobacteria bacterium]
MEILDYIIAWIVYLTAGVIFSVVSWKLLKRFLWRELAYLIQSLQLAVIFTPWYVLPEEEILAPAIYIFVLDLITIDVTTSIRALIPLMMAILLGIIVTIVLSIVYRIRRRKQLANVIVDDDAV